MSQTVFVVVRDPDGEKELCRIFDDSFNAHKYSGEHWGQTVVESYDVVGEWHGFTD